MTIKNWKDACREMSYDPNGNLGKIFKKGWHDALENKDNCLNYSRNYEEYEAYCEGMSTAELTLEEA